MEEEIKKQLELLATWMEQKRIPKQEQIKYYHKLIAYLESSKIDLKKIAYTASIGSGAVGAGIGMLIPGESEIKLCVSAFLILYGVIFGMVPPPRMKEPDFEEHNEIEKERKLIKKWYISKKE